MPKKKSEDPVDSSAEQAEKFFQSHPEDHLNYSSATVDYRVSTGSLELDGALNGGLGPGIHRFGGASEGGKTSCAFTCGANFLSSVKKSKMLYVKAEGRLSGRIKDKQGIKFVTDPKKWAVGTCLVMKSNVFDTIAEFIRQLIVDNPDDYKYYVIIDSLDALMLKDDIPKKMDKGEHTKVSGPQVLIKRLFKLISLPVHEYGHTIIPIAQVIASIKGTYDKEEQLNAGGGGGGNASIHFADNILQFMPRYKKDLITGDGKDVSLDSKTCNVVGHYCRIEVRKSEDEISNISVRYPVKYGQQGGVWNELELKDFLVRFGLLTKSGSWLKFSEQAQAILKESDIPEDKLKASVQGDFKLLEYFQESGTGEFWTKYIRNFIGGNEIL